MLHAKEEIERKEELEIEQDFKEPRIFMIATAFQFVPPAPFDFKNAEDWPKWIRRFERYREASGLDNEAEATQVTTLIYCFIVWGMKPRIFWQHLQLM